jgi:hypothetical protein
MRNYLKARAAPVLGIIALVAVIGILMTGCPTEAEGPKTIALTRGVWTEGNLPSSSSEAWYSFPVDLGTTYHIWVRELWTYTDVGIPTTTGQGYASLVSTSARYKGESSYIFEDSDMGANLTTVSSSGGANSNFTADRTGTVEVKVSASIRGKFSVTYSTFNFRPWGEVPETTLGSATNPIPMTAGDWEEDWELETRSDILYFSFPVTAGIVYNVFWDDNGDGGGGDADVQVSAMYKGGERIFNDEDDGFAVGQTFTATETTTLLLRVRTFSSTSLGTIPGDFAIVYTIGNGTMPSIVLAD